MQRRGSRSPRRAAASTGARAELELITGAADHRRRADVIRGSTPPEDEEVRVAELYPDPGGGGVWIKLTWELLRVADDDGNPIAVTIETYQSWVFLPQNLGIHMIAR